MKLSNLLQLTEHHRYVVMRRFGLSPLDLRMLWAAYQPIVGGTAAALYITLASALPSETTGVTDRTALKHLFLSCGLEPNERGRKKLVEETSKLEAVGLLRTYRRVDGDDVSEYEFRLQQPLRPELFFGVHHLWLLLEEKIGSAAAEAVRRSFVRDGLEAPDEAIEEISSPFYEVFRMNIPPAGGEETDHAAASAKEDPSAEGQAEFGRNGFRADELLRRFPRSSPNRRFVERLMVDAARLAELNFHAGRFELSLKQTVSLLDEDGLFDASGGWNTERFRARAADIYKQSNAHEQGKERAARKHQLARAGDVPADHADPGRPGGEERDVTAPYWLEVPEQFQGQCDVQQYNAMLANSPYTKILKMFFQPSSVPSAVEEAFLAMNVNYQLPDEVINVMIHYIRVNDLDWKRKYLDAIGANVAGKRIRTFENAVVYFRKAEQSRSGGGAAKPERNEGAARKTDGRRGRPPAKPVIPVARPEGEKQEATEEDIKRIMEMAKRLNNG
jgi:replication initiation and membrane attachment protein